MYISIYRSVILKSIFIIGTFIHEKRENVVHIPLSIFEGFYTLTKANFVESESTPYNGMCEIFGKKI